MEFFKVKNLKKNPFHIEKSYVGSKRKSESENQDAYVCDDRLKFYAVSDGMGGENGGKTASNLAVNIVGSELSIGEETSPEEMKECVEYAMEIANYKIVKKGREDSQLHGMGATFSGIWFSENFAVIGHIGDSRIYLIRDDKIKQLTKDHVNPHRKYLTRDMGMEFVKPNVFTIETKDNDRFLLCTDGLFKLISDDTILQFILKHEKEDINSLCDSLYEEAKKRNLEKRDDITIIYLKV